MNGVKMSVLSRRKRELRNKRIFVWSVGIISYALAYFWVESQVPFNNNSILLQWVCIAFGLGFGGLGLIVGYFAVEGGRR